MTRRGERGIWQRRYWEHTIRDERDFARHFDSVQFNPMKHGLVEHPAQCPHSSFRCSVAGGLYPSGWFGSSASRRRRVSGDEIETAEPSVAWRGRACSYLKPLPPGLPPATQMRGGGGRRCAFPPYARWVFADG